MRRKIFIAFDLIVAAAFVGLGAYSYWKPIDWELEHRDGCSADASLARDVTQPSGVVSHSGGWIVRNRRIPCNYPRHRGTA
ncbi:MAG: hypothetical protein JXB13_01585 [Phycisphaerae bacterium]|nr:hypothetical protein [Phycisphaerae bacterium]